MTFIEAMDLMEQGILSNRDFEKMWFNKEITYYKTYKSVNDYLPEAKKYDILVFDGLGIIGGFDNLRYKYDTYKFIESNENELIVRRYKRKRLSYLPKCNYNQEIAVLSKEEFNRLKWGNEYGRNIKRKI